MSVKAVLVLGGGKVEVDRDARGMVQAQFDHRPTKTLFAGSVKEEDLVRFIRELVAVMGDKP